MVVAGLAGRGAHPRCRRRRARCAPAPSTPRTRGARSKPMRCWPGTAAPGGGRSRDRGPRAPVSGRRCGRRRPHLHGGGSGGASPTMAASRWRSPAAARRLRCTACWRETAPPSTRAVRGTESTCSGATSATFRPLMPTATSGWRARRSWTTCRFRPIKSTASAREDADRGAGGQGLRTNAPRRIRPGRPAMPGVRPDAARHGRRRPHRVAVSGSVCAAGPQRLVAAPWVEAVAAHRITLTPLVLTGAAHVVVLVTGADKAADASGRARGPGRRRPVSGAVPARRPPLGDVARRLGRRRPPGCAGRARSGLSPFLRPDLPDPTSSGTCPTTAGSAAADRAGSSASSARGTGPG